MTDSKSQSPTSSVVNSIVASADEESVEAPAETLAKAAKKEESAKTEDSNDGNEEEKQSPSKAKAVKKDDTNSEKMTSLPAIIADEEGMTIPEAADGSTLYTYRCVDFSAVLCCPSLSFDPFSRNSPLFHDATVISHKFPKRNWKINRLQPRHPQVLVEQSKARFGCKSFPSSSMPF